MTPMNPKELLQEKMATQSLRAVARDAGISAAYLSDIMLGRRGFGPKVLAYLGLKKTVEKIETYTPIVKRRRSRVKQQESASV